MNTLELLLKGDAGELELPTKEVEITRLSKTFGEPCIFKLQALTHTQYQDIMDRQTIKTNGDVKVSVSSNESIVVAGVVDPSMKDQSLKDHYKALTPIELVHKLLLPGEVAILSDEIIHLSGFNDDQAVKDVEEVKN